MWLKKEARIAQFANINYLPGTDSFTSPPNEVTEDRVEYTPRRKKS